MEEHQIQGLMITAMDSIRDMIDVNTIIGEPMKIQENVSIIPISKVCFGFAAGGSEFKGESIEDYNKREKEENISYRNPFRWRKRSRSFNKTSSFFNCTRRKSKITTS